MCIISWLYNRWSNYFFNTVHKITTKCKTYWNCFDVTMFAVIDLSQFKLDLTFA